MITGSLLADRYRIENVIGRGGMGTVWLATDVRLQRPVVVKVLSREIANVPIAVTRFLREMRTLVQVQSPHVVSVLDRGVDAENGPFLVMERLEGDDLEKLIARDGPMSLREVAPIARQIADAVQVIHDRGLVHRDLKPSNVFLCHRGVSGPFVKLLDFGAVKADVPLTSDGKATAPGMVIGTLSRMSPEQVQGMHVDHRTDLWAFALLVYDAVVGKPAIASEASMGEIVLRICDEELPLPSRERPGLPASFDAWFRRSTQKAPEQRYRSMRGQVEALMAICAISELPAKGEQVGIMPAMPECNPIIFEVDESVPSFPPLVKRGRGPRTTSRDWAPPKRDRAIAAAQQGLRWNTPAPDGQNRGPETTQPFVSAVRRAACTNEKPLERRTLPVPATLDEAFSHCKTTSRNRETPALTGSDTIQPPERWPATG